MASSPPKRPARRADAVEHEDEERQAARKWSGEVHLPQKPRKKKRVVEPESDDESLPAQKRTDEDSEEEMDCDAPEKEEEVEEVRVETEAPAPATAGGAASLVGLRSKRRSLMKATPKVTSGNGRCW